MVSPLALIKKGAATIAKDGRDFFADQNLGGIVKNTVKGIPAATKDLAKSSIQQTEKGLKLIGHAVINAPTPKPITLKSGKVIPGIDPTGMVGAIEHEGQAAAKLVPKAYKSAKEAFPILAKDAKQIVSDGSRAFAESRQTPEAVRPATQQLAKGSVDTPSPRAKPPAGPKATALPPKVVPSFESTVPHDFNPEKYVAEQIAKAKAAEGPVVQGIKAKAGSFLANAKAKLVDFTAPIEDVLNETVKKNKITLKPEEDIHNQIDRVLRAPTIAGQFVKDNGLADVIKGVDNPDALDQYLIAKHASEVAARGITTGRDAAKDQALVAALAPKYEKQAQVVSAYSRKLLDYSAETGLISPDLAQGLKERYPDYVPFNRVFSELEKTSQRGVGSGVASLSRQTAVQKIVGSEREIESPIQSLLTKTGDVFKQGEKNVAGRMLAGYEKLPGNPFQLREVADGQKAAHTISYFENGVKKTYETTPEIAQAAKALNVQQLNILGRIFALPVRVARVGLTGINLPFIGANVVRDQATAFINSDRALKTSLANPNNFVRSLFSAVKHDDLYDEMIRAGGGGTSYDISRNQVGQTIKEIRAGRTAKSKILYTVTHPGQLLKAVEDIVGRSEELTRIQQYRGTKVAALKEGMDEKNATIAGARAARDTTINFARRGEWGTVLNSAFLYLNAGIQGTRTFFRVAKARPATTAAKLAVSLFTPVAAATAWNLSDAARKEAYDDIPEYEKQNNLIVVPPNPTQDANGDWNVIKIPLEQSTNGLATLVRRPLEAAHGLDPIKFKEIADAVIGTATPLKPDQGISQFVPQAIKPALEASINKNLFTGYPIVPQGLQGLSPQNQVRPTTSGSARLVSRFLGVSPIQTEAFIKSTFGGVGDQAINAFDNTAHALSLIPAEQVGGKSPVEGIIGRFAKARGGATQQRVEDELAAINQDRADTKAEKIRPIYDQAMALTAAGAGDEAQSLIDGLSDQDYELYKELYKSEQTKKSLTAKRDILPTYKKATDLFAAGKKDDAQAIVDGLTDDEYKAYTAVAKQFAKDQRAARGEKPTYDDGDVQNQAGVINTVSTYASAIGTDPITAFNRIFTGQKIRRVDNGAIVVDRMSLADSSKVKADQGGNNPTMKLDHTIPLELGGSNDQSNLILVPTATWQSYTPVENALGKALRAGTITRDKAQSLIKDFKLGKITAADAISQAGQ